MDKKMKIDVKILNEVMRYKSINNYISEQDATLPPPPDAGAVPPPPDAGVPESVDISTDPDVEKIDDDGKSAILFRGDKIFG